MLFRSRGRVNDLIDAWEGKVVLGAMLVESREIYAHAQHFRVLLRDKDGVCYPGGLFYFPDKLGCEEPVDFFANGSALRFCKTPQGLFDRSGLRAYLKCVLGEFSGDAWHVCRTPSEYFPVLTEELDKRAFLCGGEVRRDDDYFSGVRWVHLVGSCVAAFAEFSVGCR